MSLDICFLHPIFLQIFYALMDQTLHGEQRSLPGDTSSVVADLERQYSHWKHVEGTHPHTRFTHLLNYGAGMCLFSQTTYFPNFSLRSLKEHMLLFLDSSKKWLASLRSFEVHHCFAKLKYGNFFLTLKMF